MSDPRPYTDYLAAVARAAADPANACQRRGQLHFNVLHECCAWLANAIRATALDPFHRDDRLEAFLAAARLLLARAERAEADLMAANWRAAWEREMPL